MRLAKRILAAAMTGVLICCAPVAVLMPARAETDISKVPDLTDEQAGKLVEKAFEKYRHHKVLSYVLEGPDSCSYYAYDSVNDVGAMLSGVDPDFLYYRDAGVDFELNDWMDFGHRMSYETYRDSHDEPAAMFCPLSESEVAENRKYYFDDLISGKEKGFPSAVSYRYSGKYWEYGPDNGQHICYRIEIPDSDASLYLSDEDYLPKMIYIGVDDGEIYRIDEERYHTSDMETTIRRYVTHFSYPEKLEVPEQIRKNARLNPDYYPIYRHVEYAQETSEEGTNKSTSNGKITLSAYWVSTDKHDTITSVVVPDYIKVVGKKYYVTRISYEAFSELPKLKKATIGNRVTKVEESAFQGCKQLKSVTLGKRVTVMDRDVFKNCKSLKVIRVKNKKMRKYIRSKEGRKKLGIGKKVKVK